MTNQTNQAQYVYVLQVSCSQDAGCNINRVYASAKGAADIVLLKTSDFAPACLPEVKQALGLFIDNPLKGLLRMIKVPTGDKISYANIAIAYAQVRE